MSDLVSRSALHRIAFADPDSGEAILLLQKVDELPAVDAVPVVHGRWEFEVTKEFGCRYHYFAVKAKCSECGKVRPAWYGAFPHLDDEEAELAALVNAAVQKHPKFCEECGAIMDGEGK